MGSENKVALITGSATGVGAATALILAEKGWNIVINYSRSADEAKKTDAECREFGNEVMVCKADVSIDSECRSLVKKTVDEWGRIDAVVNNAGRTKFCNYADLDSLTGDDFLNLYQMNVVSAYQVTRAAVPFLKKSKYAAIVNTSSVSAISGVGSSIAYAASKGALCTLTRSLAHALAPEIRVNAICPGFIEGRWTKNFLGEKYPETKVSVEKSTLLNRISFPEDIAKGIVFLVEDAVMMTGEILTIDGGKLINQGTFR